MPDRIELLSFTLEPVKLRLTEAGESRVAEIFALPSSSGESNLGAGDLNSTVVARSRRGVDTVSVVAGASFPSLDSSSAMSKVFPVADLVFVEPLNAF